MRVACFALLAAFACPLSAATIDAARAPERSAEDQARDARDHPGEVLAFFHVETGAVVVDLWAGGGYWSELVGQRVGPTGTVYMHNNAAYLSFDGKALDARIATGRLAPNVVRLDREMGHLGIAQASVDIVLMSMTYHDLYFKSDDWSMDPDAVLAEIHALLKPGAVLGVIDHAALPGTGSGVAQSLHRIDEAFAKQDIAAHGFRFDGALDVLHRSDDDHTLSVFDPKIRGKTDRFVHRYVWVPLH